MTPLWRRLAALPSSLDERALRRLVFAGFALRVLLLVITAGSNDIFTWNKFGRHIAAWGVLEEYVRIRGFNHPPLMGYWGMLSVQVEDYTGFPFRITFKLLPLAADALCAWGIWRIVRARGSALFAWRAAAVFSLCLASILITGHHGNTDSACAALALLATCLVADGKRPWLAGLAFGAALNVKLIPLVLLPALFLQLKDLRAMASFSVGFGVALLPFVAPALYVGPSFYKNAIGYNSLPDRWGIHFLLNAASDFKSTHAVFKMIDEWYAQIARYLIMAASLGIGVWARLRRRSPYEVMALVFALFLVLTPGVGVQYMVFAVPALVITDLRRAIFFGILSGLFVGATYAQFLGDVFPLRSLHRGPIPVFAAVIGLFAWGALLELLASRFVRTPPPTVPAARPAA